MYNVLCVTNRRICKGDFFDRIESIAKSSVQGIILREKDLCEEEYKLLAARVMEICEKHNKKCILHSFINAAAKLNADAVHLPLPVLRSMSVFEKSKFKIIGASCHSLKDAEEAESLGASYITEGHIFATDCKRGIPPRGTEFLRKVCETAAIPVYAIGGINGKNVSDVIRTGAKGVCIMSGLMQCDDTKEYLKEFEKSEEDNEI